MTTRPASIPSASARPTVHRSPAWQSSRGPGKGVWGASRVLHGHDGQAERAGPVAENPRQDGPGVAHDHAAAVQVEQHRQRSGGVSGPRVHQRDLRSPPRTGHMQLLDGEASVGPQLGRGGPGPARRVPRALDGEVLRGEPRPGPVTQGGQSGGQLDIERRGGGGGGGACGAPRVPGTRSARSAHGVYDARGGPFGRGGAPTPGHDAHSRQPVVRPRAPPSARPTEGTALTQDALLTRMSVLTHVPTRRSAPAPSSDVPEIMSPGNQQPAARVAETRSPLRHSVEHVQKDGIR